MYGHGTSYLLASRAMLAERNKMAKAPCMDDRQLVLGLQLHGLERVIVRVRERRHDMMMNFA